MSTTWPPVCPTCQAPWHRRSKTMGAAHGQPHRGTCLSGHDWFEGQEPKVEPASGPTPDRYVVIVWMYDHWGVTYTSNNEDDAMRVTESAQRKIRALFIDTHVWETVGDS